MKKLQKPNLTIVMGDFYAKVLAGKKAYAVLPFKLENRNDRRETEKPFAAANRLVIMNTWFKLHPQKLYKWKLSLDPIGRIDYLLVNKRYRKLCICQNVSGCRYKFRSYADGR